MGARHRRLEHVTLPVANPWAKAHPACPHCGNGDRIYFWAPTTELPWVCTRCGVRFACPCPCHEVTQPGVVPCPWCEP